MAFDRQFHEWQRTTWLAAMVSNPWRKRKDQIDPLKQNPYRAAKAKRRKGPTIKPSQWAKKVVQGRRRDAGKHES